MNARTQDFGSNRSGSRAGHWCRSLLALSVLGMAAVTISADAMPTFAQLLEHADRADLAQLQQANLELYPLPEKLLLRARLALSKGDGAAARDLLERYEQLNDHDPARLREALARRQDIEMLAADYAAAARYGEEWERVPGAREDPEFNEHRQTTEIARQLRSVGPVRVRGSVKHRTVATTKDKVGLTRMIIAVGGREQEAVIDTGASFSVLNASTAKRLGLQPLAGAATLGSTTHDSIDTKLAVAPRVTIAGTEFASVVFLVLGDDQLEFPVPGGYRIDAILGFPELSRLGRLNFVNQTVQVAAASQADPAHGNLVLVENKLFVTTDLGGVCVPLYLDTGSNTSSLTALFARDYPDVVRALPQTHGKVGGAGGMREVAMFDWRNVPITLGRHRVVLPILKVHQQDLVAANVQQFGTLGRDVLEHGYSLDFRAMQLDILVDPISSPSACEKRVRVQ
jgi:predicted aspartyl protease